jgi:hypothetical protein
MNFIITPHVTDYINNFAYKTSEVLRRITKREKAVKQRTSWYVSRLYTSMKLVTFCVTEFPHGSKDFSLHLHAKKRPRCSTSPLIQK